MNKRRFIFIFSGIITAAALAAAVIYLAWIKGAFLPHWIVWEEKTLTDGSDEFDPAATAGSADLPGTFILHSRRLTVQNEGSILWQSPENLLIQDFLWCDINRDDIRELILLCWRRGRYGYARPFWEEKNDNSWSQHIFIYQWQDNDMHPLWMASDIGMDVVSFSFDQTNRLRITETSGRQTDWDWLSWGLSLIREVTD